MYLLSYRYSLEFFGLTNLSPPLRILPVVHEFKPWFPQRDIERSCVLLSRCRPYNRQSIVLMRKINSDDCPFELF